MERGLCMRRARRPTVTALRAMTTTMRRRDLRPLNMYGYSKHMFDLWALKHELFGQSGNGGDEGNIVGLKYFNVYGPYEDHKGDMRSVVVKSFEQIQSTGEVKLFKSYKPEYKDGEQMRDFIYVKDAVDVTLHFALQDAGAPGGLFNCGTGKARTWLDLTRLYSLRWGASRRSSSSRCRRNCRESTNTSPRQRRRSCGRLVMSGRLLRSKTACAITCRATSRSGMPQVSEAVCLGCYE